jgi:hypothetical protein
MLPVGISPLTRRFFNHGDIMLMAAALISSDRQVPV